jgi:hypothetical protein
MGLKIGDTIRMKNFKAVAVVRKIYNDGGAVMADYVTGGTTYLNSFDLEHWEVDNSYIHPAMVDETVLNWLENWK